MIKLVWAGILLLVGCGQPVPAGGFKTALWLEGAQPIVTSDTDDCASLVHQVGCSQPRGAFPWWATWRRPYPFAGIPGPDPYGRVVRNPWLVERSRRPSLPIDPDFQAFDLDGNRLLSLTEYVEGKWSLIRFFKAPTDEEVRHMKAGFAQDFQRADLTRDGWLNPYEYRYASETPAERGWQAREAMGQLTIR